MKTFLLIDGYNLYFRAMHTITEPNSDLRKGFLLHLMFSMIKNSCERFKPNHIVFCADGNGSWRKKVYPAYKANRMEALQKLTPAESIKYEELKEVFENEFIPLIRDYTNITYLGYNLAEADDLISRFIALHPNDNHIILSTDNDYVQLLADNVLIYNAMEERLISNKCVISTVKNENKPIKFTLKDGKITVSKSDMYNIENNQLIPMNDWVEYALFMKCIRGDKSDNIFSAYPLVREKSTKTKIGILDAFNDRKDKGYNWQSFMNATWENPLGEKKLVKECYEFNKKIIDLKEIPEDLRLNIDKYITETINRPMRDTTTFAMKLYQFFAKWNLVNLTDMIGTFNKYLGMEYPKD